MPAKNDPISASDGPGGLSSAGDGSNPEAALPSDSPPETATGPFSGPLTLQGEESPAPEVVTEAAERARVDLMLLRRASAGDGAAFSELVERHGKSLFRLANLLLGSAADAEDVLQETWTGAFRSLKRFEGRSSVRTWLTRILTTQVALWRRKRRNPMRGGLLSLDASPQAEADSLPTGRPAESRKSDWQTDLDAALRKLTTDHREVIVLREIEGFSYDEIAESLSVPRGTVESRLHRARGELRKLLTDYLTEK